MLICGYMKIPQIRKASVLLKLLSHKIQETSDSLLLNDKWHI